MNPAQGTRRAVFLDRDGVINRAIVRQGKPYPPASLAELELTPDAKEALTRLRQQGFLLVVVTNQPDLARGTQRPETIEEMHRFLQKELPVDAFYVCPHDDSDGCSCRKPGPGLLLRAADELGLDIGESFLIGDRWRDVAAAHSAGCRAVFIDYDYQERRPESPDCTVRSLSAAAAWILRECSRGASTGLVTRVT